MSMYYMEHEEIEQKTYDGPQDNRTVQSFKDETDINRIIAKAQKTGTISHMAQHQAEYASFDTFDFLDAQLRIARGREIFDELPSEVRREFGNDPGAFFTFVNDPQNKDKLEEVLPKIAESGRYFPKIGRASCRERV